MEQTPTNHNRRFWVNITVLTLSIVVNGVFGYLNYAERAEMKAEQRMTRTMLDARAEIQMTLVQAATEGRPLTPAEVIKINRLYRDAEYPLR